MAHEDRDDCSVMNEEPGSDSNAIPSIIETFGDMKPETLITEAGLARIFHRDPMSVKRAVERGELPQLRETCRRHALVLGQQRRGRDRLRLRGQLFRNAGSGADAKHMVRGRRLDRVPLLRSAQ